MLAFFVPSFSSLHLPSSINTSLKGSLHLIRTADTRHLSKIHFVYCAGTENCFRLGVINSPAGTAAVSGPIKKTSSPKLVFLCLLSSLFGLPFRPPSFSQIIKMHTSPVECEILVARLGGISYRGGVQVPYEKARPTRRFFCA